MAKIDTLRERPQIFQQHHLNILPVRNGLYVIFIDPDNSCYFRFHSLLDEVVIEQYTSLVRFFITEYLPIGRSMSESQAIDFAHLSSLLHTFCACDSMYLTIRGRLFSGQFSFSLPYANHTVSVSNVQIEVDAGYESEETIVLIEAKIGRREDFHARQLFYPYRQWSNRTAKKIKPLLLTYSNGVYLLTEFCIGSDWGDIKIVANRAFNINDSPRATINFTDLSKAISVASEPPLVPFPQANDMDKIVDLIQLLDWGITQKSSIAEAFGFD